jgi:hypothetical protein
MIQFDYRKLEDFIKKFYVNELRVFTFIGLGLLYFCYNIHWIFSLAQAEWAHSLVLLFVSECYLLFRFIIFLYLNYSN